MNKSNDRTNTCNRGRGYIRFGLIVWTIVCVQHEERSKRMFDHLLDERGVTLKELSRNEREFIKRLIQPSPNDCSSLACTLEIFIHSQRSVTIVSEWNCNIYIFVMVTQYHIMTTAHCSVHCNVCTLAPFTQHCK